MPEPSPESYRWVADPGRTRFGVAGCVTVVTGRGPWDVLAAIGADRGAATSWDDPADGTPRVSASDVAEQSAVLIEVNGWEASRPEALAKLSKSGKAAAVFWNVNDLATFSCARRGKLLVQLELPHDGDTTDVPRSLVRLLSETETHADTVAVAMAMLEKFTGVAVPEDDSIAWPTTAYPVTEPVLSLRVTPRELLDLQIPTAEMVAAAQAAGPAARRRTAEWSVRQGVEATGLGREIGVLSIIDQFDRDKPTRLTREAGTLRSLTQRRSQQASDALNGADDRDLYDTLRHWMLKYWVMEAIAYTTLEDDVTTVLGATSCISIALGDRERGERFLTAATQMLQA